MSRPPFLVIIFQGYLVGVSRLESEGNPPVLRHGHSPLTLSVALQRMSAERQFAPFRLCCSNHSPSNLRDMLAAMGLEMMP